MNSSCNGTFLFDRAFMDYHSEKFKDYSLMIYKNDNLIAIIPANKKDNNLHSHQGLTYGGLVFKTNFSFRDALASIKAVLQFLVAKDIDKLYLKMLPLIYQQSQNNPLDYLMLALKAECYRTDILLAVNPEQKRYSKDRKAGYKRGVKNDLYVEETNDFTEFWNTLLIPTLELKHNTKPVHTLEEITALKINFKNQIRQFNVYHDDTLVGGTTIFETNTVAHSQYIASNTDKNVLGSLDFLHAYLLENVFNDKPYFDFGTSNENDGKQVNEGLLYWKEGFGARAVSQCFYSIDSQNFKYLDSIFI